MISTPKDIPNVSHSLLLNDYIGFYFKVISNFTKDVEVRFNILNLYKSKSLY
jgi:hypothetical protein